MSFSFAPQSDRFEKISPTALLVTYVRQFTDIPYTQELADWTNAHAVFEEFAGRDLYTLTYLTVLMEARYKMCDRLLAKSGCQQVLELASGLLPRGMVMSQNPDVVFVESDLPGMSRQKQAIASDIIGIRPNLMFETIDATAIPSQFPTHAKYWRPEAIAILCEGLLQYLTFAEKARVCTNVKAMLNQFGGVWITPDLTTKERRLWINEANPSTKGFLHSLTSTTGRSMLHNSFDNPDHAKQFFLDQGFTVEEHSMLDAIDDLTCLDQMQIDRSYVETLLGLSPVFVLRSV